LTLQEFVERHQGEKVDWDKAWGAQCVDLARQYFHEVWGIPQPEGVVGAQDFARWQERPKQNTYTVFEQVMVRGQPIPAGAVVIFRASPGNKYGHIAICLGTEGQTIRVFEQDGFKQDGAKIGTWTYEKVAGYLMPREAAK